MLFVICALSTILLVCDFVCYINAPYEVRADNWWSWLPGSGFLAQYLAAQQSVHLTAEPSGKIETNIDEDALHQWVYGTTRRK